MKKAVCLYFMYAISGEGLKVCSNSGTIVKYGLRNLSSAIFLMKRLFISSFTS